MSSDSLLELATRLARSAGQLAQDMRGDVDLSGETKSSATDVVTAADKAAETLIVEGVLEARPDDSILGEEGGTRTGTSDVRWLVDPIDGTTNYVYGIPAYAVSVAAEVAGELAVGVVYDPAHERCYSATAGGGAFLDGRRLEVKTNVQLGTSLVGTGFGYLADRRRDQAAVLLSLLPQVRDIRRFGSAALDLCFVAEGQLDAYYEKGLHPWDLAAGWLIAKEAGATVGDLNGGLPGETFTLAANPILFSQLADLLRSLDADKGA